MEEVKRLIELYQDRLMDMEEDGNKDIIRLTEYFLSALYLYKDSEEYRPQVEGLIKSLMAANNS